MTNEFISQLKSISPTIFDHQGSNLVADGIIDSFDFVRIITMLEDEYRIKFETDDLSVENFSSPHNIWDLVVRNT